MHEHEQITMATFPTFFNSDFPLRAANQKPRNNLNIKEITAKTVASSLVIAILISPRRSH
jgi:hypothetical protein